MRPALSALTLVAIALAGTAAQAQGDRYAPVVAQLPSSPRAAVLGSTAGVRDIDAIFGNPALVGLIAGTLVGVARYDHGTLATLASAASLGAFNVGVGAMVLDADGSAVRFPFWSYALTQGGPIPVSSTVGVFALATTWHGARVGAGLKYLDERHAGLQDATPSLDLGIGRDLGRLTAGLTVQNIGAGLRGSGSWGQLPLRVSAGAAGYGFVAGPFDVGGSAGISVLPDGELRPAAGFEIGYVPLEGYLFQARVGLRRPELNAQQRLSFGGSASLDRFTLDYAYEDWAGGGAHRLALRVR